jgi:hypothetical protein
VKIFQSKNNQKEKKNQIQEKKKPKVYTGVFPL